MYADTRGTQHRAAHHMTAQDVQGSKAQQDRAEQHNTAPESTEQWGYNTAPDRIAQDTAAQHSTGEIDISNSKALDRTKLGFLFQSLFNLLTQN